MHSFLYRFNALLTFSLTILALICGLSSFSDNFNDASPSADLQVLNVNWFHKQYRNDEVSLRLNVKADLRSLFTWNTKQIFVFVAAEYETPKNALNQISLWDAIIPTKEEAKFSVQVANKYHFTDQGSNLLDKPFNLTLHWHVMPKTGKMFADKILKSGYRLPEVEGITFYTEADFPWLRNIASVLASSGHDDIPSLFMSTSKLKWKKHPPKRESINNRDLSFISNL